MPIEHEKELRAFGKRAAKLAGQIHQDWGSAVEGGVQARINIMPPTRGPDPDLQSVERALGAVVQAINDYLRRP
jgi:hypothetical protein